MTALTVAGAPRLRRLPVPLTEPRPALRVLPDAHDRVPTTQHALDLRGGDQAGETTDDRTRTQRPAPAPAAWARQFVQAALEVAAGRRPPGQLVRWASEDVYATLCRRALLAQRIDRPAGTAQLAAVRSVRVCRPADGVVEASAVVVDRGRVRAVALRLEDLAGRWRVSALEIG